eukprot:221435_1
MICCGCRSLSHIKAFSFLVLLYSTIPTKSSITLRSSLKMRFGIFILCIHMVAAVKDVKDYSKQNLACSFCVKRAEYTYDEYGDQDEVYNIYVLRQKNICRKNDFFEFPRILDKLIDLVEFQKVPYEQIVFVTKSTYAIRLENLDHFGPDEYIQVKYYWKSPSFATQMRRNCNRYIGQFDRNYVLDVIEQRKQNALTLAHGRVYET